MAKIILMEYDATTRQAYAMMLRSAGHTVQEAVDGREGIQLVKDDQFDVAILDLMMPERDGIEVLRFIKHQCPDLKTLIVSSSVDFLPIVGGLGADRLLPKPISSQQLIDTICELMES